MSKQTTPAAILGGRAWLSLGTPRQVGQRLRWNIFLNRDFEMKTGLVFVASIAVVLTSLGVRDFTADETARAYVHLFVLSLISLFFLVPGLWKSRKTIGLLQNGKPGFATTVGLTEALDENYGRMIKVDFNFKAPDGSEHSRQIWLLRSAQERLTDEAEEPCLYDPEDPSHFVVLDEFPGEVRVADHGGLETNLARGANWGLFVIPAIFYVVGMFVYPWIEILGV